MTRTPGFALFVNAIAFSRAVWECTVPDNVTSFLSASAFTLRLASFKGQQRTEFALFSTANAWLSTSSARAARKIIEACRYGTSELVITPQAKLPRLLNGVLPSLVAETLSLVSRILPGPAGDEGDQLRRGWESQPMMAPSLLTRPADSAVSGNKEVPQPAVT